MTSILAVYLKDAYSGALMTDAVTFVPCGHTFNEETAVQYLAKNKCCPIDEKPIDGFIPNLTIRDMARASQQNLLGGAQGVGSSDEGKRSLIASPLPALSSQTLSASLQISPATPVPPIAFGAAAWRKYFGDVGDEPPLPSDIGEILNRYCPFWPSKKIYETQLLVLIPETINGQPLTLKLLGELIKKPLQGNVFEYNGLYLGKYIDLPAPRACWMLMTRDVVEGSRKISYKDQQALLAGYCQKGRAPYIVPTILDATVSICVEYVRSGTWLYGSRSWTYTRCQEKYSPGRQLIVGGCSAAGLNVGLGICGEEDLGVMGSLTLP